MEIKNLKILAIINKAKDGGATVINAEFSGGGDSGDIDEINCGNNITEPYEHMENQPLDENDDTKLKDYLYEVINDSVGMYGDWVNNSGGYGNLIWNIVDNTFKVDYVQNTTEDIDIPSKPMFA
tara:strand:+ start:1341 stop:1712 length:372 start_codon:yes stop_codon:yes gene_type:complete